MSDHRDGMLHQIMFRDKYKLAPMAWLIVLYTGTAMTAGVDVSPEGGLALIWFETRHVIMHSLVFAIQAWLIAYTLRLPGDQDRAHYGIGLVMVILALGLGQEALQSLYRNEIRTLASLWDLLVDVTGGVGGWWWYQYRINRHQQLKNVRVGL